MFSDNQRRLLVSIVIIAVFVLLAVGSLDEDTETDVGEKKESSSMETEVGEKSGKPDEEVVALEIEEWDLKRIKAGYPGNYRIEVYAEGWVKNPTDKKVRNCKVLVRFLDEWGQWVTQNSEENDLMYGHATWHFHVPAFCCDKLIKKAKMTAYCKF